MEKILVSACLLGDKVRYDGRGNYHPNIKYILENFDVIPFCPEVEGGLSTPRIPSEIINDEVINKEGRNVTRQFSIGADKALTVVKYFNIKNNDVFPEDLYFENPEEIEDDVVFG